MRLKGLGLAGEYACTMRMAKGFATGNGRFAAGGVVGARKLELEPEDGGDVSGEYVGDVASGLGGESSTGRAGTVGRDARGDGGGSTKEVGRREFAEGASDLVKENEGTRIGGMYSVS